MLRIALCEDKAEDLEHLRGLLQDYLEQRPALTARISTFQSGAALLAAADDNRNFDLYLLDILMPSLSGIELGVRLREQGEQGAIIYLSASSDFAVDSYQARAFYYLIKPVTPEQLFPVLDQAITALRQQKATCVSVKTHQGIQLVAMDDILYAELVNRSIHYHLSSGETVDSYL